MSTQSDHARRPRLDSEPPSAVGEMGCRYHHIGIPTQTPRPNGVYLPAVKMYVSGFRLSPYGVQWMCFDDDCPLPEVIKTVPHVAFEVDNLAMAIEGKEILIHPNSPSAGVTVAMIIADGAPVELLEFRADLRTRSKSPVSQTRSCPQTAVVIERRFRELPADPLGWFVVTLRNARDPPNPLPLVSSETKTVRPVSIA